jgi:hypothetical protein
MSKIEEFKEFVKTKPELATFVKNGDLTWQNFYEMWFLYGKDHDIWKPYAKDESIKDKTTNDTTSTDKIDENNETERNTKQDSFGINELVNMFKKVDMNSIKNNIAGVQKAITLIQEMTNKTAAKGVVSKTPYNPRPIFKRFED